MPAHWEDGRTPSDRVARKLAPRRRQPCQRHGLLKEYQDPVWERPLCLTQLVKEVLLRRVAEAQDVVRAVDAVSSSLGRLHSGTLRERGMIPMLSRLGPNGEMSGIPVDTLGVVVTGSRALASVRGRNRPRGRRHLLRGMRLARNRGCRLRGEHRSPHQGVKNQSSGQRDLCFLMSRRFPHRDQLMCRHLRPLVLIGCPFRSSQWFSRRIRTHRT